MQFVQCASEQHVLRTNLVIDFGYGLALAKPNNITKDEDKNNDSNATHCDPLFAV